MGGLDCDWNIKCKKNQAVEISFDYFKLPFTFTQTRLELLTESGISGLEKTAPPGELEFSTRSKEKQYQITNVFLDWSREKF